jgi:HSP20 family protein
MGREDRGLFDGFERLRRDLDRLTSDLWSGTVTPGPEGVWAPAVDIHERDDALVLLVDLPGLRREDIDLRVDADGLTIRGARSRGDGDGDIRLERPMGEFQRAFRIGVPIDAGGAEASYRDGVLWIRLPRAERRDARRVRVPVE